MNKKAIFLFSLLLPLIAASQKTVIRGSAAGYAGKVISVYTYTDPVIHQKKELAETKIDKDGSFSVSIQTNKTIEIYTDLEKYTGTLVIGPGKDYQITFPPFTPRNAIEAKSPYFKPALYWFGLPQPDKDDLNEPVRSFITDYNEELVRNTSAIFKELSKETANNIIQRLEQKYDQNKTDYFKVLKKYSYADLENIVNPGNSDFIITKYFKKEPVKLTHPAYQKMFQLIFNDFLRKESTDFKNKNFSTLVNNGDFSGLQSFLEKQGYGKEIAELVIIKGLYDGYYTGLNKENVIKAIDRAQNTVSEELIPVVKLVKGKITRLAVKGKAPAFQLKDQGNKVVSLDKFRGKFLYLNFIRSNSSECRAELDSLKSLEKKLRQVLTVVSISTDENFDSAAKLWKTRGYSWDVLNGSGNKQLIENYKAEVIPVFYLIDPEGNLILSPAPSPSHEFEPMFIKLFRDYRFRKGQ